MKADTTGLQHLEQSGMKLVAIGNVLGQHLGESDVISGLDRTYVAAHVEADFVPIARRQIEFAFRYVVDGVGSSVPRKIRPIE